jgi:hypothetical protein
MQHFYDGAIRRYLTQTIRVFSEFTVRYGDGTLHRVPVGYGDGDRQTTSVIRQNSENTLNSIPRISIYIYGLDLDRDRLADSTFVSKKSIRERDINGNAYTNNRGRNYTIERVMPTPFKLTMKVDIWSANTDQKLQILEQILVLFNPSLEIQSTDNYIDWTSISVLNLDSVAWTSRSVPVGNDSPIDIATLTVDSPIWISPPVKVKQLGVITKVITGITDANAAGSTGFGTDYVVPDYIQSALLTEVISCVENYTIEVLGTQITLYSSHESDLANYVSFDMPSHSEYPRKWEEIFEKYPKKFIPGVTRVFLMQRNGTEINGTVSLHPTDDGILLVDWDYDTLNPNTGINSQGYLDTDDTSLYNQSPQYRPNSPGTFDAIIDPLSYDPHRPLKESTDQPIPVGLRYLIIEDIGSDINADGASAWKSNNGSDLVAHANDIIEWTGSQWNVVFDSIHETDTMIWQTNTYTGIQYLWNGISWVKSFEGIYPVGKWRLEL